MKYAQGSFITVPSREILRGIDPKAQALYMWLCSYANETGTCFPSRKTLANDIGCSERTVDAAVDILIETGLLKTQARKDGDKQVSNLYTVLIVPPLAESATPPSRIYTHPLAESAHELNPVLTQSNELDADASEIVEVPIPSEGAREKRATKTTSAMQAVFDIFSDNPARHIWKQREIERTAAQVLFDEYGVETLRTRYQVAKRYRADLLCPQIISPSTFLDKMPNMERFLKAINS